MKIFEGKKNKKAARVYRMKFSKMITRKVAGISGIIFVPTAFLFILTSVIIHRDWWDLGRHALSHLGALQTPHNYIFNGGLVLTGILGIIFAIGLRKYFPLNKVQNVGVISFLIGMLFLIYVGVFPLEMPFHVEGAAVMFLLSFFGILLVVLGDISKGLSHLQICCIASITAIILAVVINIVLVIFMFEVVAAVHGPIGGVAIGVFTASHGYRLLQIDSKK